MHTYGHTGGRRVPVSTQARAQELQGHACFELHVCSSLRMTLCKMGIKGGQVP